MNIQELTRLFDIKDTENGFSCFLYPSNDSGVWGYGYAAVECKASVSYYKDTDDYLFHASIASIDDSGVSFFAPRESQKKAMKRLESFREWIKEQQHCCPSKETVAMFCLTAGITADYW